jgi:hypothetical protein
MVRFSLIWGIYGGIYTTSYIPPNGDHYEERNNLAASYLPMPMLADADHESINHEP